MSSLHNYNTYTEYCTTLMGSYTEVGKCREITAPELSAPKSDATHLRSPNFIREYVPSWRDPGEAGFKFLMNRATYTALKTHWDARTLLYWKLHYPVEDGDTTESIESFAAKILSMTKPTIAVGDDLIMCEVKLAVSGGVTYTGGT